LVIDLKPLCYLAIFLLLSFAVNCFFRLDISLAEWIQHKKEKKRKIRSFKKKNKLSQAISDLFDKYKTTLIESKMPKVMYLSFSACCGVACFFVGQFIYNSLIVAITVGFFGLFVPVLFFSMQQTKSKFIRLERLASSMMILSNSYISTEDFITTVKENLSTLEYPAPFKEFLSYVTYLDSDISLGLRRMQAKIDNPYFLQWIDALVLAQDDRALKYVAVSVVESLHDVLEVQKESNTAMYAVWREYFMTLIMVFAVPLIFKILMPDAFLVLTTSFIGQSLFVLLLLAVIYSVIKALKVNRPLLI